MFLRLRIHRKPLKINRVDLSRQKELHTNPKVIQQIEFCGQLKKLDGVGNATDVGNDQSKFVVNKKQD